MAPYLSHSSFWVSRRTRIKSNLLSSGLARARLTVKLSFGSYLPLGLVAAMTEQRELSLQTMP